MIEIIFKDEKIPNEMTGGDLELRGFREHNSIFYLMKNERVCVFEPTNRRDGSSNVIYRLAMVCTQKTFESKYGSARKKT